MVRRQRTFPPLDVRISGGNPNFRSDYTKNDHFLDDGRKSHEEWIARRYRKLELSEFLTLVPSTEPEIVPDEGEEAQIRRDWESGPVLSAIRRKTTRNVGAGRNAFVMLPHLRLAAAYPYLGPLSTSPTTVATGPTVHELSSHRHHQSQA